MSSPKVSVIVITYNQEATIGRALQSLLHQDFSDYEIVVADDASTDSTRAICLDFQRRYPRLVRVLPPEPNLGLVRNYFRALRACQGEYVTDCAGDDYWCSPSKLSAALAVFAERPEVNVVYSDFLIRNMADGSEVRAYSLPKYSRWARPQTPSRDMLHGVLNHVNSLPYLLSAALYRRRVALEALAQSPQMVCNAEFGCEDLPLMAALAARGDAAFTPEVTMVYSEGGETVSAGSRRRKLIGFYFRSLRATRLLAEHYGVALSELTEMFHAKARYLLGESIMESDSELAAEVTTEIRAWHLPLTAVERLYSYCLPHRPLRCLLRWLKSPTRGSKH